MTEEEKTLKYLSAMRIIDFNKLGFICGKETIDKVLNLIQKQQEEIEKKEHKYRDLKLKYEQNLKMCKHFRKELNKQDKIIDEMANYIITHHQVKTMKKTFCENCTECEGIVRDCIKQYFERKVEV